jgi:hypothetical protein
MSAMKHTRRIALWAGAVAIFVGAGCAWFGSKWDVLWQQEFTSHPADLGLMAYDMVLSPDGGTMTVGLSGPDALVIRLDRDGRELAHKLYEDPQGKVLYRVRSVPAGGYIAGGMHGMCGWLVRLDEDGDTIWTRDYGDSTSLSTFRAIAPCADGGFAAAGLISDSGGLRLTLVRLDAAGSELWRRQWNDSFVRGPRSIYEQPDGGFMIASTPTTLIRTDVDGETLWTREYSFGTILDLCPEPGGGFFGTGDSSSWVDDPQHIVTARFNADGETLWTRSYREEPDQKAYRVATTPDGGCAVFGMLGSFLEAGARSSALVLKYDPDGRLERKHTLGSEHSCCSAGAAGSDETFTLAVMEYQEGEPGTLNVVCTRP